MGRSCLYLLGEALGDGDGEGDGDGVGVGVGSRAPLAVALGVGVVGSRTALGVVLVK
jgi:hypothetical protein